VRLPRRHTSAQTTQYIHSKPPRPPALLPRRRPNLLFRRRRPRSSNGGDLVMRVQPRQERPAKPCAQILGTAQTSTAAITPKRALLQERIRGVPKATHGGRKKGGASGRCAPCHPMSGLWRAGLFSTRCFCPLQHSIDQGALPTRGARGTLDLGLRCPGRPVGEQFGRAQQRRHRGPDI
jgi:hypothetical protein